MAVNIEAELLYLSTPDTLAGLSISAWYRPEELVEDYDALGDTTPVALWRDASGNGRHLYNTSGGASRPLYYRVAPRSSFWYPCLVFSGAQWMNTGAVSLATLLGSSPAGQGTVFVVARANAGNTGPLWAQNAASRSHLTPGATVQAANYDGTQDVATLSLDTRTVVDDDTNPKFKVYMWRHSSDNFIQAGCSAWTTNGLDDNGIGPTSTPTGGLSGTDIVYVGQIYAGGATYLNGAISEMIWFNYGLTQAQRRQVMRYLRKKYGIREDQDFTGVAWTSLLPDVVASAGIQCSYGLPGSRVTDRVADTGQLSFTLNNSAKNSAGLRGYYTPGHANALAGWGLGTEILLRLRYSSTDYYKWRGYVSGLEIAHGANGSQLVTVRCVDWMDVAARASLKNQSSSAQLQVSKRSDQVLRHLATRLETPPPALSLGYGSDTYPYALDSSEAEDIALMSEFQRLANSELGYVYLKGDTVRGGVLTFESRLKRGTRTTGLVTLDQNAIVSMDTSFTVDDITNEAQVSIYPRRVDSAATSVLFSLQEKPAVARNTMNAFFAPYVDPTGRSTRVGGTEMVTPAATTDYTLNTLADGTGTDITGQLTVTATFGASGANVTVVNNGPLDGYLTKFQLRGKGIYAAEAIAFTARDSASQLSYGKRVERFEMPYQSNSAVGLDCSYFILNQGRTALERLTSVSFVANLTDELATAALAREISDKITVQDTTTGGYLTPGAVNGDFFINSVSLSLTAAGPMASGRAPVVVRCTWGLAPALTDEFWLLQVTGFTELGDTTRLSYGFFTPMWQLDVATLGTDTIVNAA